MLEDTALVITAHKRPAYLRRALRSWAQVPEAGHLAGITVALGDSPVRTVMAGVIADELPAARIRPDSPECAEVPGEHRALGEAIAAEFAAGAGFVIATSEDVVVSDDVLGYFAWARALPDPRIAVICAHNSLGQGWQPWHDDTDADQTAVRLVRDFSPWCWGVSAEAWEWVIRPDWDWDCTSGDDPMRHGWDWQVWRIISEPGILRAVMPDASRALNIGQYGGVYASPGSYPQTIARSFRPHRENVTCRPVR